MTDTNQPQAPGPAETSLPSSEDLFRSAMTPDPIPAPAPIVDKPAAEAQPAPQPAPPGDPPRDEHGRFAPRTEQTNQAPAAATQQQPAVPGEQPQPPDEGNVPSWRVRELREQRDAIDQQNRQLQALLIDHQRQLHALRQIQTKPAEPPPIPDVITDPQAYYQHITSTFEQRLRNQEANFSFRIAHDRHGEVFEQAYGEMIGRAERGDPSIVRAVMQSPDPGTAMMNWFRRESTLAKVGEDPDKWFEKQLDERLKDQKFAGSLLEKMRGQAAQQPAANGSGVPRAVNLPPSLNSMAASAPAIAPAGDMSDASLFDFAFRQGRPAR